MSFNTPKTIRSSEVDFREAFWVWVKVAVYSFGGPAGQIAVMHRILVEEKKWISENRFLHALNYTMLLPGPEAQQLATYIGWLLHRTPGGLVAGTLFILPGFLSILALSVLYAGFQEVTVVQAIFFGLKPAVVAVVVEAVIRIGRRALKNKGMVAAALIAFSAIFFFNVPFPLIVLSAGLVGYVSGRKPSNQHSASIPAEAGTNNDRLISDNMAAQPTPSLKHARNVLLLWLTLWFGPLLLLALWLGADHILTTISLFFSRAAVVTFGGAYAVLAYVAQEAVSTYGWLQPGEMLDGLGMAETTPGPLIQVVQFVGFMGAFRNPAPFSPFVAGIIGSLLTTWVTFTPCFLWIFLGAPYIEWLRGNRQLNAALATITAAVVGVILNLAIWFSLHTLFTVVQEQTVGVVRLLVPIWSSLDWFALFITVFAFLALLWAKRGMLFTLVGSALWGILFFYLFK
ncbi:MAG: chromate efflux transporter [Anaerolineae bacterium]|nr:chromate efflux transporter [Anaerolineae bacterium]